MAGRISRNGEAAADDKESVSPGAKRAGVSVPGAKQSHAPCAYLRTPYPTGHQPQRDTVRARDEITESKEKNPAAGRNAGKESGVYA